MKCFGFFSIIALSCFCLLNRDAHSSEIYYSSEVYYIDDNRVLLYKVINWWYDCLPEESEQLCGSSIKCQSKGATQVEYNQTEMRLKLWVKGGFGDLLSIFERCDGCLASPFLQCTWLNRKYFGKGEAVVLPQERQKIDALVIEKVDAKLARLIQSVEKDISFELEGVVGGLLNGKIALHRNGNFLKRCPRLSGNQEDEYPISLNIINSHSKEILAKYTRRFPPL